MSIKSTPNSFNIVAKSIDMVDGYSTTDFPINAGSINLPTLTDNGDGTATAITDDIFIYPGTGTFNQITAFPSIDISGAGISATIQFRLARTDSLTGNIEITFFDYHAEYTTIGSRQEYIK